MKGKGNLRPLIDVIHEVERAIESIATNGKGNANSQPFISFSTAGRSNLDPFRSELGIEESKFPSSTMPSKCAGQGDRLSGPEEQR